MFPNKPVVMNPEAFRYFHVFPLMVRPHARTEDGNNLLHSELLFKINYYITTRYPSLLLRVSCCKIPLLGQSLVRVQ